MLIKTSDLVGTALDWAVAKCEGFWFGDTGHEYYGLYQPNKYGPAMPASMWKPSTNWSQGGPIIEREKIDVWCWEKQWGAGDNKSQAIRTHGATPLIAAMRCYVASKLGDMVEVPDALVN